MALICSDDRNRIFQLEINPNLLLLKILSKLVFFRLAFTQFQYLGCSTTEFHVLLTRATVLISEGGRWLNICSRITGFLVILAVSVSIFCFLSIILILLF